MFLRYVKGRHKRLPRKTVALFVRINSGDASAKDKQLFKRRYEEDQDFKASYLELEKLWAHLESYPIEISSAFNDTNPPTLIESQPQKKAPHKFGLSYISAGLAASLMLAFSIFYIASMNSGKIEYYQTQRGERLSVNLADGSLIQVNSASKLAVKFDNNIRHVALEYGEALFEVAKDKQRKFIVHTDTGDVEAVGTAFNVNHFTSTFVVTVVEGTVLVTANKDNAANPLAEIASVGQQVSINNQGKVSSKKLTDVYPMVAWTKGKMILSGETLKQAIEQVNRQSKHHIEILDARLRSLPLFGVFNTGDTKGFLSALEKTYPLTAVQNSPDHTYLVYRKST